MPPTIPAKHLTTCIQVRAAEFIRRNVQAKEIYTGDDDEDKQPDGERAVLAAMSVIGDRFARYLPPNFCVQLSECGVLHNELRLFLSPAMRNSLTMCHVFKMNLLFIDHESNKTTDSIDELQQLFSAMRSKLTYISHLEVEFLGSYTDLVLEQRQAGASLRSAFFTSLPTLLQSLTLSTPPDPNAIDIDANCEREASRQRSSPITVLHLSALGSSLLYLSELRLRGRLWVSTSVLKELFRVPPQPSPRGASSVSTNNNSGSNSGSSGTVAFFPNLRRLEAVTETMTYMDVLSLACSSELLPRLTEFAVRGANGGPRDVNVSALMPQLHSLAHLRVLGAGAFSPWVSFSGGLLDLRPLSQVREIAGDFLRRADFNNTTLDLSVLTELEKVGSRCLWEIQNVKDVILPPNVRHIDEGLLWGTQLAALDFEPIAHSLQTIDVSWLAAHNRSLLKFDSTPLAGKIVGRVECFLADCCGLVEVDLSGFRGLTSIGPSFFYCCEALARVLGMDALGAVEHVGAQFFLFTTGLATCDFSAMISLKTIESNPLQRSAMEEVGKKILLEIMEKNNNKEDNQGARAMRTEDR